MDPADAKRFLISRVITEAALEHVPLLDVEKKMLAFSESDPSFTENIIEINEEFERNCDTDTYEEKIGRLLKNARDRDEKSDPNGEQTWIDALQSLRKEDHYILVMVAEAFPSEAVSQDAIRMPRYLIYVAIAIILVFVILWHTIR
ncbi:MAG: hypothetical protein WB421_00780 [Terriglobales bacterium]